MLVFDLIALTTLRKGALDTLRIFSSTDRHDLNNARKLLLFTLVNNPFSLLTYKPNVLAVTISNRCSYITVETATLAP
jgi:hypothetical protein